MVTKKTTGNEDASTMELKQKAMAVADASESLNDDDIAVVRVEIRVPRSGGQVKVSGARGGDGISGDKLTKNTDRDSQDTSGDWRSRKSDGFRD